MGFYPACHFTAFDWEYMYLFTFDDNEGSSTLLYPLFSGWILFSLLSCVFQFLYGYCKVLIKHLNY